MAKTTRIEIDLAVLERLTKHIERLEKKDAPAAEAARERVRLAFRGKRSRRDFMPGVEGAAHCLDLVQYSGKHDFGREPEEQISYLVTALERLADVATDLTRISAAESA